MTIVNSQYLKDNFESDIKYKVVLLLDKKGITKIEKNAFTYFKDLIQLSLSENEITEIPTDTFSCLTNLTVLWLYHNKITDIPEQAFQSLSNLQQLYLNNNMLTFVPVDAFKCLTNLTALWLSHNQITSIPVQAFQHLSNLKWLTLHNNKLTFIPRDVFTSTKFTEIALITLYNNNSSQKIFSFYDQSQLLNEDLIIGMFTHGSINDWTQFCNQFEPLSTCSSNDKSSLKSKRFFNMCCVFVFIYYLTIFSGLSIKKY